MASSECLKIGKRERESEREEARKRERERGMGRMAAREQLGKKGLSGARTFTEEAPLSEYTLYVWMAAETPANSQQKHLQAHVQRSREHNRPVNQNKICIRKGKSQRVLSVPC